MAETSSLLNCRAGYRTGGSNPPPSASYRTKMYRWSIHLMVRIQDSQSWHRGSIPLSTTKVLMHLKGRNIMIVFFLFFVTIPLEIYKIVFNR